MSNPAVGRQGITKPAQASSSLGPVPLTALEARLLQFHYLSQKTLRFISQTKKLIRQCYANAPPQVPVSRFVLLQTGVLLNINDILAHRAELLYQGTRFNPGRSVEPSPTKNAVSFECLDQNLVPYDRKDNRLVVPQQKANIDSLKLLELLLINYYEIYKSRIQLCEQSIIHPLDYSLIDIGNFEELSLFDKFIYLPPGPESNSQDGLRDFTRTNEFNFLETMLTSFSPALFTCKEEIETLRLMKTNDDMVGSPYYTYLMHRSMLTLLRLADLYAVIRKVGKQIYLNHSAYLMQYARAGEELLRRTLQHCDMLFTRQKQNQLLLTVISRYTRQGTYPLRTESLMEFFRVGTSTITVMAKMVDELRRLLDEWHKLVAANRQNEFARDLVRDRLRRKAIEDQRKRRSFIITTDTSPTSSPPNKTLLRRPPPDILQPTPESSDEVKGMCTMKDTSVSFPSSESSDNEKATECVPDEPVTPAITVATPAITPTSSPAPNRGPAPPLPERDPMASPLNRSRSSSVSSNSSLTSPSLNRARSLNRGNSLSRGSPLNRGNSLNRGNIPHPNAGTAAALAVKGGHITAQQRFQQQMMKAAQNGAIYSRPIENRAYLRTPQGVRARSSSNASSISNASPSRSRSSTVSSVGNLEVCSTDTPTVDADGNSIKKVRFAGVKEYSEDEDAPTPMQMHKQLRQKFTLYSKQFRYKTKDLNSQEGMAFRQFRNSEAEDGTRMMSQVKSQGKFTKLFKRR